MSTIYINELHNHGNLRNESDIAFVFEMYNLIKSSKKCIHFLDYCLLERVHML